MSESIRFNVAIPARFGSQRLPGKPLLQVSGKPMIQHVFENAIASGADQVVVATDDERIVEAARGFGAPVCLTSSAHPSGSDRIAEAAALLGWPQDRIIVNLQGDEPMMPPANIRQVAENLHAYPEACIATLCIPVTSATEYLDANAVKVVRTRHGLALYFSRSPVPMDRDAFLTGDDQGFPPMAMRHVGLYAYRLHYLASFLGMPPCPLEQLEKLEQLRALWNGDPIHVDVALEDPGDGVDTADDLRRVEEVLDRLSARV